MTNRNPGFFAAGALGFVSAPPKKGKTWLGLSLALSVATGMPFLDRFEIPEPRDVVYLALEGHRAALRARIGCLARGLDLNPDGTCVARMDGARSDVAILASAVYGGEFNAMSFAFCIVSA